MPERIEADESCEGWEKRCDNQADYVVEFTEQDGRRVFMCHGCWNTAKQQYQNGEIPRGLYGARIAQEVV